MERMTIESGRMRKADDGGYILMSVQEYNDLQFSISELKRINRERANADRGLTPKKQRSGYLLLSYDSNILKMEFDKETLAFEARRLLLESPYNVRLGYLEAERDITDDLRTLVPQLFHASFILKGSISSGKALQSLFAPDSRKALILTGIEAQRNGMWAVRLYANFSPEIPEDLISIRENK